jgi:hypothetical protein
MSYADSRTSRETSKDKTYSLAMRQRGRMRVELGNTAASKTGDGGLTRGYEHRRMEENRGFQTPNVKGLQTECLSEWRSKALNIHSLYTAKGLLDDTIAGVRGQGGEESEERRRQRRQRARETERGRGRETERDR